MIERFSLAADDGFTLSAVRWLHRVAPRAVLQISHSNAEHAVRYSPFAEACAAAGIAVYAHDHRGHGGSVDASTPLGHFADRQGWNKVVGDLHTMRKHILSVHRDLPVFLFGHSMGSFIARDYLLTHSEGLAGAILSATGWRLGPGYRVVQWVARREVRKLGVRVPSALITKLIFGSFNVQFTPTRTRFDWLSRDPRQVDGYVADPLCGFDSSGQLWDDFMGGVIALERDEDNPAKPSCTLPLLLIAGSRDPVSLGGIGNTQLSRRYRAAGNANVTIRRYPGGRHELLNETNRTDIWADLIGWIQARAMANPDPAVAEAGAA
jgi:alpha-beta hydrolase superfamily lysophospholipase